MKDLTLNFEYSYSWLESNFSEAQIFPMGADPKVIGENFLVLHHNDRVYSFILTGYNINHGEVYKLIYKGKS